MNLPGHFQLLFGRRGNLASNRRYISKSDFELYKQYKKHAHHTYMLTYTLKSRLKSIKMLPFKDILRISDDQNGANFELLKLTKDF